MKNRLIGVLILAVMVFGLPRMAYCGFLYEVPTITVVNSSSFDLEIIQVKDGASNVVKKGGTGENLIFQTRLENLIILGGGKRSATYLIKAYYRGTRTLYGDGPNLMLTRDSRRRYRTERWSIVTRGGLGGMRTRIYNTRFYSYRSRRYGIGYGNDTLTFPVGDGVDPPPVTIRNEDIIPVLDIDQPPF